jgi:para-aminobenzoate synthetase/4-amino-4-deoxychorismate lyase
VRRPLPGRWTPAEVLRALRHEDRPVALVGSWVGGTRAIVGAGPTRTAGPGDDLFRLLGVAGSDAGPRPAGPADAYPADADPTDGDPVVGAPVVGDPVVGGGWFGYLGYQLNQRVERLPPAPGPAPPLPDGALAWYDHVLVQDGAGRWWFEALPAGRHRRQQLEDRHRQLAERLSGPPPPPEPHACAPFRLAPGPAAHRAAVAAAVEHIAAGDIFQANICLRAESTLDGDPLDLFVAGAAGLRPAHGAYVRVPEGAVCSFSPELFLRAEGPGARHVRTAPIKGTAPRHGDPATAAAQRAALLGSAKDRAENVMIVDLMRNDLGRVCRWGTVAVPELVRAEPHPGVWHLVSDVVGELREGLDAGDLVRAAFPPGSCTGAPKVRAMEVINDLEATARGAYTGAVGLASPRAGLALNVAIRTIEWASATGALVLGVGGGIVADSRPDAELRECVVKASPILAAVGATLAGDTGAGDTGAGDTGPADAAGGPRRTGAGPAARVVRGW